MENEHIPHSREFTPNDRRFLRSLRIGIPQCPNCRAEKVYIPNMARKGEYEQQNVCLVCGHRWYNS